MGPATTATIAWLVAAMMAWSPVTRKHVIPEAQETVEAATERYHAIAETAVRVTFDPSRTPVIRAKQDRSRASSALLVLSTSFFESGFRRDVDLGLGRWAAGDFGKAHCLMQLELGKNKEDTSTLQKLIGQAWSANDVTADREKCLTAGYILIAKSFTACRSLELEERLAAYASGSCEGGRGESAVRVSKATRWYEKHKAPNRDSEVLTELQALAAVGGTHRGMR